MLSRVADGVLVHQSTFMQTNTVVVEGRDGVLLVDPGIRGVEMAGLAVDLRELGLWSSARRDVAPAGYALPEPIDGLWPVEGL